jgi:hypothetical protein
MAYSGSTELSSAANPPRCVYGGNMWGKRSTSLLSSSKVVGQNLWMYNTTDGTTEIVSNTYFTDGSYLGMREGDLIMGAICTGTSATMYVGVIGPVTTDGCGIASTNGFVSSTA